MAFLSSYYVVKSVNGEYLADTVAGTRSKDRASAKRFTYKQWARAACQANDVVVMHRATKAEKQAENLRHEAELEARRAVVAAGKCPQCGSGIRRNLALAGWYQCEQYGAEGFRKDASRPACSWQTFTQ